MKKSSFKLLLIFFLSFICFIFNENKVEAYTNHTQQEAINWATYLGNISWNDDYNGDGWGCQCVDLINAYYDYLVGYRVSGDAKDYASNSLPAGWTRVDKNAGARPRRYCCMGTWCCIWLESKQICK